MVVVFHFAARNPRSWRLKHARCWRKHPPAVPSHPFLGGYPRSLARFVFMENKPWTKWINVDDDLGVPPISQAKQKLQRVPGPPCAWEQYLQRKNIRNSQWYWDFDIVWLSSNFRFPKNGATPSHPFFHGCFHEIYIQPFRVTGRTAAELGAHWSLKSAVGGYLDGHQRIWFG